VGGVGWGGSIMVGRAADSHRKVDGAE
jgi:hypothetical protein